MLRCPSRLHVCLDLNLCHTYSSGTALWSFLNSSGAYPSAGGLRMTRSWAMDGLDELILVVLINRRHRRFLMITLTVDQSSQQKLQQSLSSLAPRIMVEVHRALKDLLYQGAQNVQRYFALAPRRSAYSLDRHFHMHAYRSMAASLGARPSRSRTASVRICRRGRICSRCLMSSRPCCPACCRRR